MALRSFIARVELEYIVVVDDSDPKHLEQAKRLAEKEARDDSINADDFELGSLSHIPGLYELDSDVSHTGTGSLTVAEAIKLPGGYDAGGTGWERRPPNTGTPK